VNLHWWRAALRILKIEKCVHFSEIHHVVTKPLCSLPKKKVYYNDNAHHPANRNPPTSAGLALFGHAISHITSGSSAFPEHLQNHH
jgi:hypothetical protein